MDHPSRNHEVWGERRPMVPWNMPHDCDSSVMEPLLSDLTSTRDRSRSRGGRLSPAARLYHSNNDRLESNYDYLRISQRDDPQYRNAQNRSSTVNADNELEIIEEEHPDQDERTDDAIVPQIGNTDESRLFRLSFEVKIKAYKLCILSVVIPVGFLMTFLAYKDFHVESSPSPPAIDPTPTPISPSNPPIPKPPSHQPTPSPRPIPPSDRMDSIKQCAMFLSGLNELELDDVQFRAVSYFATSPGTDIDAPLTCTWDSEFGQVYSLIVFREAARVKEENWFTKSPLERCEWPRIHSCDEWGHIQTLNFGTDSLSGSLPSELSGMLYLKNLKLYSNAQLTGSLPSELGLLPQLTSLQVHQTSISGPVPTELGSLSALEELFMHRTFMTGTMPAQVCALRNQALQRLTAPCRGGEEAPLVCNHSCCSHCSK